MKILVPLKHVPDPDTRIRVRPDGLGIETGGVKFTVNPFDAIALEEALRLKERLGSGEVIVAGIGGTECAEALRAGLAMGADRAVLVRTDALIDSLAAAKVLAALCHREQTRLVLMGKQAIDDDSCQAGQMLAALLGVGQATFVSKLSLKPDGAGIECGRETDAGVETVAVALPAVVTVDLRLNEPRYVSVLGIMKAKKKPIEERTPAELGVDATARARILKLEAAPKRRSGVRVTSVEELINRLRNEARVI